MSGECGRVREKVRIKLLSATTHRYVCQDRDDHYVYIVMTLCDETLEARIKRGGLESRGSRMSAWRQLCDGIAYLHLLAEAITHRDVKPSYILFKGERLKIADMGQSRVLQHGETAVVSTALFRTALCCFTAPKVGPKVGCPWKRLHGTRKGAPMQASLSKPG